MSTPAGYQVLTEFDVPATMRDGVTLRANIYRPVGEGAFPVLLTRLPYGKDLPLGSSVLNPLLAARRGYIVVVQDTRGRFTSEGEWHPFLAERDDGYDAVEWAAQLPGSNGQVGMYGASYFGFTQWAAARANPPHLHALMPFITWADPNDGVYLRGGAIELGVTRHWSVQNSLDTAIRRARPSGDPRQIMGAMLRIAAELDAFPTANYAELPVRGYSQRRNDDALNDFDTAIDRRADREYTDLAGVSGGYDDLALPAYHVGGWYDIFLQGTLRNFTELTRRGKAPQKLLIGPWSHSQSDQQIGAVNFGFAAQLGLINLQIDFHSLELRWFDRWLKDIPNGIDQESPIQLFVMGINR